MFSIVIYYTILWLFYRNNKTVKPLQVVFMLSNINQSLTLRNRYRTTDVLRRTPKQNIRLMAPSIWEKLHKRFLLVCACNSKRYFFFSKTISSTFDFIDAYSLALSLVWSCKLLRWLGSPNEWWCL